MSNIVIVPTGTANTASVMAAFDRLGIEVREAAAARDVSGAHGVVLPGGGAFGAAIDRIDTIGLRDALKDRIGQGRPTLVVCLGMQLLCRASEESPDVKGLGVIDAMISRFRGDLNVPQLGWNHIEPATGARFLEPGWAYFANSYRLDRSPDGWTVATTDYGGRFVSAMERGDVLACQFHPELSGEWGALLLDRWLETTRVAA